MKRTVRPTFFSDTTNSERYTGQILTPYFENASDKENEYGFPQ